MRGFFFEASVNVVNTYLGDGLASHVAPLAGDRGLNQQEQGVVDGLVLEALRAYFYFACFLCDLTNFPYRS